MTKKNIMSMLGGLALLLTTATLLSAAPKGDDEVMTKEDGMYVVNTTTLGKKVTGYVSTTPLKIYIKGNKIQRIEALPNRETPKYFLRVKKELLTRWDGKSVKKVLGELNPETDAVTGATMSSNAVVENVKRGLQYYQKHKK